MPSKLSKSVTRRIIRRTFRKLSPGAQVSFLIFVGFILGVFTTALVVRLRAKPHRENSHNELASFSISPHDNYHNPAANSYAFIFATGRSGTQHLSRVLTSLPSPRAYITHEEEHLHARTKFIVARDYRPLATQTEERAFNRSAAYYVSHTKIPFYSALLKRHGASRLVYTGHLPLVFGLAPALIDGLPKGSLRIVRVRRDRIATAASLMALGDEREDPWGTAPPEQRRWFPTPTDAHVRLAVTKEAWQQMNRFQRWLWYVDDVECRWQALRHGMGDQFSWMEESLEGVGAMDGGEGWLRIARFIGVAVDWDKAWARDNSIQYKKRIKTDASEATVREWDVAYRKLVGQCRLSDSLSFGWQDFRTDT